MKLQKAYRLNKEYIHLKSTKLQEALYKKCIVYGYNLLTNNIKNLSN